MTGSGGRTIASHLVDYLQARAPSDCHWTVFDRNLLERTLEDHHLPKRIAEFMPEGHKSMLSDMLEELLGMHPSSWTLVQQTSETILRLAQMGYVILVGRGGNIITRRLPYVLHVRLVGSLENRIRRIEQVYELDRATAENLVHKQDKGKACYVKEHFNQNINDPLLYHWIINTDRVDYEEAARLIGNEAVQRFHLEAQTEATPS